MMVLYKKTAINVCPFSDPGRILCRWSWRGQIPKGILRSGTQAVNLAVEGRDLQGTHWIWEATSLCTRWLLCSLVISPGPAAQSPNKDKTSPPSQSPLRGV